jgi:hypothetical protein
MRLPQMKPPDALRVYHVTTSRAAEAIKQRGFNDGDDPQGPWKALMTDGPKGVWLAYSPLGPEDLPEGRRYTACFAIDVPRRLLDEYEYTPPGADVESWCIPAAELNALGRPERVLYCP